MEFYCLIGALIMLFSGHLTDTSSALHIDIIPPSYTEESTGSANVTCSLDNQDTGVDDIFMMEIEKSGSHQPLVFLRHSGLQEGAGISDSSKFQIEGLLADDVSESYVKLSILDPTKKDQGTYTCKMFYSDPTGLLMEHRASSNFTVDKLDLNYVVRELLGKVTSLEKKLDLQTDKVDDLTDKNRDLAEKVDDLTDKNKNLSRDLAEKVDDLTDKNRNLSRDLVEKVSEITKEAYNQSLEISQIADQATYSVAFSASLSSGVTVTSRKVVIFDYLMLNQGNCYNKATGEFAAPRKGLYAFYLTLWTSCGGCRARVHIKADDATVATLFAYDKDNLSQSSVDAILELQAGAKVKAVSWVSDTKLYGSTSDDYRRHSKFSGHLVRLL